MNESKQAPRKSAKLLPDGVREELAIAFKCTPEYVSNCIHHPEKYTSVLAVRIREAVAKMNEIQRQRDAELAEKILNAVA